MQRAGVIVKYAQVVAMPVDQLLNVARTCGVELLDVDPGSIAAKFAGEWRQPLNVTGSHYNVEAFAGKALSGGESDAGSGTDNQNCLGH